MSDKLQAALTAVANRLVELAAEEASFRADLLNLLDAFQVALRERERSVETRPAASAPVEERLPSEPAVAVPPVVGREEPATPPPDNPVTPERFSPLVQDRPTRAFVPE